MHFTGLGEACISKCQDKLAHLISPGPCGLIINHRLVQPVGVTKNYYCVLFFKYNERMIVDCDQNGLVNSFIFLQH